MVDAATRGSLVKRDLNVPEPADSDSDANAGPRSVSVLDGSVGYSLQGQLK